MRKFRKPTIVAEDEQQRQQSHGEVESIPVFKERGKGSVQDKGKARNTPKHG